MMITIHAWVSGKVQRVYFRHFTQKRAQKLKLVGWVQNSEDGRVEIIATGEKENIEQFIEWLWKGSPTSKVNDVFWEPAPYQVFDEFSVKR